MHQNGNPFRRHPWSAFLTILHPALCPRRCLPWVAKPRRLAERWLAAALSRSLTATPPPEANHHIFFFEDGIFSYTFFVERAASVEPRRAPIQAPRGCAWKPTPLKKLAADP